MNPSGVDESRPMQCRCRNRSNVSRRRCKLGLVLSSLDHRDRERRIRDGASPGTLTHGNE